MTNRYLMQLTKTQPKLDACTDSETRIKNNMPTRKTKRKHFSTKQGIFTGKGKPKAEKSDYERQFLIILF